LTDDEEGEAVEGEANHGLNVTTEDTLPAYLNPKKAKLFSKRKGKK
jgi:hypothetical protein